MSFDRLQKAIRKKKAPLALPLGATPEGIPPQLRQTAQALSPREGQADALLRFSLGLIDALADVVPAVVLRVPYWLSLGWEGLRAMEQAAHCAGEKGLFVIADARQGDSDQAILSCGGWWLGKDGLDADCLTVSAYEGSGALAPLLELCRETDKCLLALVRTANPSASEVQDLISGDRVLCQVLGDLTQRLGQNDVGEMGYSRLGAVVGVPYPSDLRALRKRLENTFFLLPASLSPEDARFAFDKYGRGALMVADALPEAWKAAPGEDYRHAAQTAAAALKDGLREFITIL